MNRISDEKIKAIAAEYLVNGMVKTKALITVGYSKSYAEHGGLKLFDNDRLKDEIAHQQTKIAAKTGITVAYCQNKLLDLANEAKNSGKLGVAKSCYDSLLKSIGGFQQDKPNEETQQQRRLAAERTKELKKALSAIMKRKYLASEEVTVVDVTQPVEEKDRTCPVEIKNEQH